MRRNNEFIISETLTYNQKLICIHLIYQLLYMKRFTHFNNYETNDRSVYEIKSDKIKNNQKNTLLIYS